jgi:hypothetical protein
LYSDCSKHTDLAKIYKNIDFIYEKDEENYSIALSFSKRALKVVPNNKHRYYIPYESIIITLELKLKKKNFLKIELVI